MRLRGCLTICTCACNVIAHMLEAFRNRFSGLESGKSQHILNQLDWTRTTVLFTFPKQDFTVVFSSITRCYSISVTKEFWAVTMPLSIFQCMVWSSKHGAPFKMNFSRASWIKFQKLCSSSINSINLDLEHSHACQLFEPTEAAETAISQTIHSGKQRWEPLLY